MIQVDVTNDEAKSGYSALNKLLGQMKPSEKIKHMKELRQIGRVIEAVKFSTQITDTPKKKPKRKQPVLRSSTEDGQS